MTDNNGKALREAKACLADTVAMTHTADRLKTALAALVEAVEAAPVGEATCHYEHVGDWVEIDGLGLDAMNAIANKRVRVLAVGEERND